MSIIIKVGIKTLYFFLDNKREIKVKELFINYEHNYTKFGKKKKKKNFIIK